METILKQVKPFGKRGAHITLPLRLLNKKVQVIVTEEIEIVTSLPQ